MSICCTGKKEEDQLGHFNGSVYIVTVLNSYLCEYTCACCLRDTNQGIKRKIVT